MIHEITHVSAHGDRCPGRRNQIAIAIALLSFGAVHWQHGPNAYADAHPSLQPPQARHHSHIEVDAVEVMLLQRAEREARPLGIMPFDNSDSFTNPVLPPWQRQPQIMGSRLPLFMAGEG